MYESGVKNENSLAKVRKGRVKATKQVARGSAEDTTDTSHVRSPSSCERLREKLPAQAENRMVTFVPVLSKTGKVLMPTTVQRARELIKKGKAKKQFRVGIMFLKLIDREIGEVQDVVASIDSGSKREGYCVKSKSHTYLNILSNAIGWVKDSMEVRRNMRKTRRGRNTPYRKCRFNRAHGGIPPSTKARWQLKLRIVNILRKLFPITDYVIEDVKATCVKNSRKWNVNFSPLQIGKEWLYGEIRKLGNLHLKSGWETKELRDLAGLKKTTNKMKETFSAHNVDSFVLANSVIGGHVKPDNTSIYKLDTIQFHRRQLHRLQPDANGIRKPYGGTISLGFKKGSIVNHPKYGFCYIGGNANGRLSLHNISTGKRISQNAKKEDVKFLSYNYFKYYKIKEEAYSSND